MVKNPNWQEAYQLAIYKRGRGVELGATEKQLLSAVRARPGTSGFQVRRPNPVSGSAMTNYTAQQNGSMDSENNKPFSLTPYPPAKYMKNSTLIIILPNLLEHMAI